MSRGLGLLIGMVIVLLSAQPDPVRPDPEGRRPIAARETPFIEDLTWMEVRDAMRGGKDTVIIATGGIEQNGPYLVTGKHNVILRATTTAIARKINALVAPIIPFVPEGDIDPPTGHMRYPGTISLTEETYQQLLTDICLSFHTHGFKNIVLIGDSGGNQAGMESVAQKLNTRWAGGNTKAYYIAEYYDFPSVSEWLKQQGIVEMPEGLHDDFAVTAMIMAVDPESVRTKERIAAGKFRINGINLAPKEKTIEWGRRIIEFRADATVNAYRNAKLR